MLSYGFMQRALFVGLCVSIAIPCVGLILVLRKFSMLGDALSHTALAGVCFGLVVGISPTIGAIMSCIIASFSVSIIGKRMKYNEEIAIAVILSLGVGISGILSNYIKSSVNINSFLFGSIISISGREFALVIALTILILIIFFKYYYEFMFYAFNEKEAQKHYVNTRKIDILFTILIGLTISISARVVGALIISSLLVLPVACGLILGKSYKSTLLIAIFLSMLFVLSGLTISYYIGLSPGGAIVILGSITLMIILLYKKRV